MPSTSRFKLPFCGFTEVKVGDFYCFLSFNINFKFSHKNLNSFECRQQVKKTI